MVITNLATPYNDQYDYQFQVSEGRLGGDTVTCNFLGQSVQFSSGSWNYPTMSYATLANAIFAMNTQLTYTAENAFGNTVGPYSGYFMSVEDFIYALYRQYTNANPPVSNVLNITTFQAFCDMPNTIITVSSGGYTIPILGSQVQDGSRRTYSGGGVGVPVDAGFLLMNAGSGTVPPDPVIRFVIGQLATTDVNSPMCVTFSDGGFQVNFTQAASLPKWNDFDCFLGPVGSVGTRYVPNYSTDGYEVAANSEIRFAIDQNDLLSGARLYYNVSNSSFPAPPTVTSYNGVFNFPSPQFTPGGVNYEPADTSGQPTPIILTGGTGTEYYYSVVAIGSGAIDSDPQYFHFELR